MEKPKTSDDSKNLIIKIFSSVVRAISKEVHSTAGKINLFGDIFIGLIIALQIISSGISGIVSIIANAIKGFPAPDNNVTMIAQLIILLISFLICLIFISHTSKVEKMAKGISYNKK